jgi:D-beta-D-heptose 7-phosphate kinase/D-beta-D-heptose 1-phosphate adenosyltransferase
VSILERENARRKREQLQASNQTVVFTNGCFDILHPGHIHLLTEAKKQGDYLIVGLNTDDSVREIKGDTRPIVSETDRAIVLNALEAVDDIVFFDQETPLQLIEELTPDVLVKGSDYQVSEIVGADHVQSQGGRVHRVDLLEDKSTTRIIETIRSL